MTQSPQPLRARAKVAIALATWFGCGYFPIAPGTVGSLAALAIALAITEIWHWPAWAFGGLALAGIAPAIWASGETERWKGAKDPGIVVVDEVLGQWLTIAGATALNWKSWLAALLLFRLFDIWKPQPARRLEALGGGAGIVLDDLIAGAYGALALFILGCFNLY